MQRMFLTSELDAFVSKSGSFASCTILSSRCRLQKMPTRSQTPKLEVLTISSLNGEDNNYTAIPSGIAEELVYMEWYEENILGRKQRAEEIVGYVEQEVEKMKLHEDIKRKKVYYAWSKGRVFSTSCRGSLVDLSMQVSGAENACPLTLEAPNISAESLYKWNPDLIVLWNSKLQDVYSLKELEALPAVIEKQVYSMEPTFYYDPHTVKFLLFAKQIRHCVLSGTYSEQPI
ncbi:hypothetical protein FQR65_LT15597 [Abscondita terminalis]|nr:hypothetical protein FQR65_LT15597 [Abscondita terminalis]